MKSSAMATGNIRDMYPTMVFVAHAGGLEAKSALLAASLADYYMPGKIACCTMQPYERWGEISDECKALFEQIGVQIHTAINEIDENYPHGNKIGSMKGIHGPAVFLDSDILLMAPFSWHFRFAGDAAMKAADLDTFRRGGGSWARVWSLFDLPLPTATYTASISGEKMRPYFNAGFIYVKDGDAFTRMWIDTARRIDANERVSNKRPWLDQIAIPVAFARLGWKVNELSTNFNYPCHLTPLDDSPPYFAHYHWPSVILNSQPLLFRTKTLVNRHPLLRAILERDEDWSAVLAAMDGENK